MPKKVIQPNALGDLLSEQTASTRASLEKNPTVDNNIVERGGVVPQRHTRKKTVINRKNARTIFFDDKSWTQLDNVAFNNRVNFQRIVQTAVADFLEKYYDTKIQALNQEGIKQINKYESSITL